MTLETIRDLNTDTLEKIKDLVRINKDSVAGFRDAAEVIKDDQIKLLFATIANQRAGFADVLNRYVMLNEDDTEITTSWRGMFHRWWLDLRGTVTGGDAHAVLAEAERGEDAIKQMYEEVIQQTAGSPLNDVLLAQYAHIMHGHDTIRHLRDLYDRR